MQKKNWKKSKRFLIIVLLLLIAISLFVFEEVNAVEDKINLEQYLQELNEASSERQETSSSLMMSFAKMMLGLVVVLITAFISLRLFKKHFGIKSEHGWLQVIAYDSIGHNKGICLVKVGEKTLVLGVTEQNINKLSELTSTEMDEIQRQFSKEPEERFGFDNHLQESIKRMQSLSKQFKKNVGDRGNG